MRFGLLFKPLDRLFIISERNIALVPRELQPIFRRQVNGFESKIAQRMIIIIKVKFLIMYKVCHKVICLQLNAARITKNYFFINREWAES